MSQKKSLVRLLILLFFLSNLTYAYGESLAKYFAKYKNAKIIGNSLPGDWRPFNDKSPWNTPIPDNATVHPLSNIIIQTMELERDHLAMVHTYATPIWVVNSANMKLVKVRSDRIYDTWDKNYDGWSDVGAPLTPEMWGEPTEDGQILVVDPFKNLLWDLSTYRWSVKGYPVATTFDIWNLNGTGVANPPPNTRWVLRGGRSSGFPGIAGLLRPEELEYGVIRHALVFSFNKIRRYRTGAQIFIPPACRSDGRFIGIQFPIMGMRFQLNPKLTEKDFDRWGLNREGKIIARALQKYGMFLGLTGGPMKLIVQLLAPTGRQNVIEWEKRFPGIFENVKKIPTSEFRVIYTGKPIIRKWRGGLRPNLAIYE